MSRKALIYTFIINIISGLIVYFAIKYYKRANSYAPD